MIRTLAICLLLLSGLPLAVAAQDIAMPAGARLALDQQTDPGSYALPIAPFQDGRVPAEVLEGRIQEQVWRVAGQGLTTLQLLAPLRKQITAAGYEIRLDCAALQCGGFNFRFNTRVLPGPEMYVDLTNFRFLSATSGAGQGISLLVSRSATAAYIQMIRVGKAGNVTVPEGSTPPAVVPVQPQGSLAQALETTGRFILSDLDFETGASTLGPGPFKSLTDIANYLRQHPERKIALVGHTDSVGSLEGNINLSRKRATSVLERLVSAHDANRAQLEAGGMGYLAPVASNLTAEGRDANRRVEAVLVSTE
ncbi:OmpA family protein [Primorskyibacter aestuariivivens]|uniref:OmpA family protein n=1 Tax=Primorskyibacter aestuariivivens TaxID=1888912 RepID=UPI0022FFEFF7|nr:OmpA family protein [Primorskyibacter aestuariivivens]MDA7429922.1 OmpA family protein [Primorskyibacter aestuariivivens]